MQCQSWHAPKAHLLWHAMTCTGPVYSVRTWHQSLTTLLAQKQPCLQDVADVCFPIADGREATLMHGEFSNAFAVHAHAVTPALYTSQSDGAR